MNKASKWRYWIAAILSLGFYPRLLARRALLAQPKISLKDLDLTSLIASLGGVTNISGLEYTPTRLKFFVVDRKLVQTAVLEKMPFVSGMFLSGRTVSLLVGDRAKTIAASLEKQLNLP